MVFPAASLASQLKQRRRGGKAGGGPTVVAPLRDQVYGGGPLTPEQRAENSVVALLATLFFVILAEGVFLAGSVRGAAAGRGGRRRGRCRRAPVPAAGLTRHLLAALLAVRPPSAARPRPASVPQGFMPESLDRFAQDVVLPAFSPTLALFLAISTAYGLWKVRRRGGPWCDA